MDKYDLLEAMGGIRDQYIEDAGIASAKAPEQVTAEPAASSPGDKTLYRKAAGKKLRRFSRWSTAVAALLCVSIILPNLFPGVTSVFSGVPLLNRYFSLVTFRKPSDKDLAAGSRSRDSGIYTMGSENPEEVSPEESSAYEAEEEFDESESYVMSPQANEETNTKDQTNTEGLTAGSPEPGTAVRDKSTESDSELSDKADESSLYSEGDLSLQSALSEADINNDVRTRAQAQISDFEKYISDETGYESLNFLHEVTAETEDRLSISVTSCTEEDDNYLQTNHFVIDKSTGECLPLHSLFEKGVDYITPVSENIKEQMRKEMEEDSFVQYSLDSSENLETDFKSIRPDQDYYINENGNLVICFDVEEVAPLYMGAVEFIIPQEVTDTLLSE